MTPVQFDVSQGPVRRNALQMCFKKLAGWTPSRPVRALCCSSHVLHLLQSAEGAGSSSEEAASRLAGAVRKAAEGAPTLSQPMSCGRLLGRRTGTCRGAVKSWYCRGAEGEQLPGGARRAARIDISADGPGPSQQQPAPMASTPKSNADFRALLNKK